MCALLHGSAHAQSTPNFSYGQVPSAGQWNAAFASKQDRLTYTPLNQAGGTMSGRLATMPSTVNGSGFSLLPGAAPASPSNGDMWISGGNLFVQLDGQPVALSPTSSPTFAGTTTTSQLKITGSGIACGPGAACDASSLNATVGGVQKSLASRFNDLLNAELPEYSLANLGVLPNSGNDVSAGIIAAANALPSTGARLKLACGVYLLSSTAIITNPLLWIQGGGQNCTTLRTTAGFTSGDVIKLTGLKSGISDVSIEHVATDTNAVRTGGFTVNLANAYGYIRNVSMRNCFVCIRMGSQAGWNSVDHVMLQSMADGAINPGSGGILVENDVVGAENWISHTIIMSNFLTPIAQDRRFPTFAVKLADTGATIIDNSDFISVRTNLLIQPSNVAFMASGGSGYAVGDTLTVSGGTLASGKSAMTISVTSVSGTGLITGYQISNPGGYTVMPPSVASIANGGSGYVVGDTLNVSGGTLASGRTALQYTVTSVGPGGAITGVSLTGCCSYTVQNPYVVAPQNPVFVLGGTGSGATLTIGNTTGGSGSGAAFFARAQTVQATRVNSSYLDSAQRDNISITPGGSAYVFDTGIVNSWITNTNASDGTLNTNGITINGSLASLLTGTTSPVMNTRWSGGLIVSTTGQTGSGLVCADASPVDTSLTGAVVAGWAVGVDLAAGCGHVTVSDNAIGAYSPFNVGAAARTNQIGIRAQGGSGDYITFHDNRLFGNTTAALGFGATGRHNFVHDNAGYNPVGPANVTVTASPMALPAGPTTTTYFVQGGSSVVVRDETNNITFGLSGGQYTVPAGAIYQLLYSAAPTVSKMVH